MEEKKKYTNPKIEAIMIEQGDVIATSPDDPYDPEHPVDPSEDETE